MARNIAPQDVSWFLDLHQRGRLDLSPPYQRRSVWTPKERRFFLDTVFNGYPCPPLFLYKSLSDEGVATYHVVDGKQRLETIINFASNKIALPTDLIDETLASKKWKQLEINQKKQFWNYQFAVEMLDVVNAAVVKEIFDRYNRTSKNLERQELRHAKYDGWFVTTAEEEARKEEWRRLGIVTTALARRMRDVQFISELMIVVIGNEVRGFDQDELDEFYAKYDMPQETDPNFAEEDFVAGFERAKEWIIELNAVGGRLVVGKSAKSYTHFYTLWAVVALNFERLRPVEEAAARLEAFMEAVAVVLKTNNPEELVESNTEHFRAPYAYAQHARGASTELPQRTQRYNIMLQVIADSHAQSNEDPAVN